MKSRNKVNTKARQKLKINTDDVSSHEVAKLIVQKIIYLQEIIRNTILSIQTTKNCNIFSNSDVNICISSLNELYEKMISISQKNSQEHTTTNNDNNITILQQIIDKLAVIISGFGTKNIDDLIFVSFGTDFLDKLSDDPIITSKFDLIRKYAHPIGYKIFNWNKDTIINPSDYSDQSYCENKITEEPILIESAKNIECFDIAPATKSFHLNIYGMRVVLQNEKTKKTLIVSCVVDDIMIDFFSNTYIDHRKQSILKNIPNSQTFDEHIIQRIVDTLRIKDILVFGNNDIYKKNIAIMSDVNSIKYNKIELTIKKFMDSDVLTQRNMLANLLIYDKEDNIQYITYLLYDLITVNTHENIDSQDQRLIYDSFPWKMKTYFKDAMKLTVKYTQDMSTKYDSNRISFEQQIYFLKAPDNVKEKAFNKLREIKGKGDDSSTKAKQYLDGLLKIPFGIFKQEPILKMMKNINTHFSQLVSENDFIDKLTFEKKPTYTNVEILHILKTIKTQLFFHFIENAKLKIAESNLKQLNIIIQYIQTMYKTNIIQDTADTLSELSLCKTKETKCEWLLSWIDIYQPYMQTNIAPFYKLYDSIPIKTSAGTSTTSECSLSKIPNEINAIETNIQTSKDSLVSITDVLNESIYGHMNAKNQIMKIFGQWITGEQSGYCFGFEGSPGIGKTSLAKKGLANCLKDENGNSRPFAFIALGGSCNGSTLEGHSYTYVNSIWGRIVDILMETKCMNPIIYIDELDKVSNTEHGKEIIGILTHLIDTTQNDMFQDKYFSGIDIDLSKVLFVFSYNDPDKIDRILLDRIHRIKFDNLSIAEKIVIVDKYIIPDINKKMGFSNTIILEKEMAEQIIECYTVEPGVRKLKEVLFDLYGEINIQLLKSANENITIPIRLTIPEIEKYLEKYPKIEEKKIHTSSKIGIMNGLWANSMGNGGVIPIETTFFPCNSFLELRLTGLQGDVMKESMNVAKTLAWDLTDDIIKGELINMFETTKCQGLHIHCPEGGVSKDGPSAGTAITVALYSLFNQKKIINTIGITGEINLQGNVTAIGGLENKFIGGIRSGIKTFIYPSANKREFEEFEKKYNNNPILDNIRFISVDHIKQVLEYTYEK